MGELGELAELFQWRGDGVCADGASEEGLGGWSDAERDSVGQELADVSIYLIRMADVCGINLASAALRAAESGDPVVP